jgi:hypothetical protein
MSGMAPKTIVEAGANSLRVVVIALVAQRIEDSGQQIDITS